jgi:hypothetical protein
VNNTNWTTIAARLSFFIVLTCAVWLGFANSEALPLYYQAPAIKVEAADTTTPPPPPLIWPNEDDLNPNAEPGGITIPLPDNIKYRVEYNPVTGQYELVQTVGDLFDFRPRTSMSLEEYMD